MKTFSNRLSILKKSFLIIIAISTFSTLFSQTVMNNDTVTLCNGIFYDSGGESVNYSDNENLTKVFYPANPGSKLRIRFNSFFTEPDYDFLYIYDGPNTSSPQFTGSPFSGPISITDLTASELNTDGAITLRFTSDEAVNEMGWDAVILCAEGDTLLSLITTPAYQVSSNTALAGGEITYNGTIPITSCGVCWSTTPNPTIADNITSNGTGSGTFSSDITGLNPLTIYYLRAYATTSTGTVYGNEVSFTTMWSGYTEVDYTADLEYFHPAGGSYPDTPYITRNEIKTLKFVEDGIAETWFGAWPETKCRIILNPDNSVGFEVDPSWPNSVTSGDPNDASKISHRDPVTGIIYLYYYYWGASGYRIFWEVFTPPIPAQAPTGIILSNTNFPFKVKQGTIITSVHGRDPNIDDTLTVQLVPGYGENHYFVLQDNLLKLNTDLNLSSSKDFNLRFLVGDNTGLNSEFDTTVHSNSDEYEIQTFSFDVTADYVKEISVINNNITWVEDWSGKIGRTIDGGKNWAVIDPPIFDNLTYGPLFAIDSLNAWLVGSFGNGLGIYKTSNGGETWVKQITAYNPSSFADIIYFWNKNEGFTLGDTDSLGYMEIYTTSNGGDNWVRVPQANISPLMLNTVNTQNVLSVYKDTVWVSGNSGGIFRSADKGHSWEAFQGPLQTTQASIVFVNGKDGILSSFGTTNKILYATHDGGETWSELNSNITFSGSDQNFFVIPGTSTIAATDREAIYFSADLGNTWVKSTNDFPFLYSLDASNSEFLWAGGRYNQVYKIYLDNLFTCQADFSFVINNVSGIADFTSSTEYITNFYWDFGDGEYSTEANPEHTYTKAGLFHVCLSVSNSVSGCQASVCKDVLFIPAGEKYITADFSFFASITDNSVSFTDLSTSNTTDWYWTMGDGKIVLAQNPVHTYAKPGVYSVCLTAVDRDNVLLQTVCKDVSAGANICTISSDFGHFINPLTRNVAFINKSGGEITDYFWTFGDGGSSGLENPVHNYSEAGYYEISLSVRNKLNSCVDVYAEYIQVGSVDCRAGFTYAADPGTRIVNFLDESNGDITHYLWDFGDGTFSVLKDPFKLYTKPGIYQVGLTIIDNINGCIDNFIQSVQVGTVDCSADFISYVDSASYTAFFTNRILGEGTALLWTFGDGRFSTHENPVHVFPGEGIYSVGLNTYDFDTECMDYYEENLLIGSLGNDCEADFIFVLDPANPEVKFSNKSIGDIVSSTWNFGEYGADNSDETNPTFSYQKGGYYNVCLTVTNSSGISNMNCKWVLVEGTAANDCRANFMFTIDSLSREVVFKDNSFGTINKYSWNFGDNQANSLSSEKNPVHTYDQKGYYLVHLQAENTASGCVSSEYKLLNVADAQILKAAFAYEAKDPDKKFTGYPVDMVSASSGDGATVEWDFGDKQIKKDDGFTVMDSTSRRVTHYYQKPGQYEVCLRISDPVSKQTDVYCSLVYTKYGVGINEPIVSDINLRIYPNPLTDYTNITYTLAKSESVEISVYDELGRKIETLVKSKQDPDRYVIKWETGSLSTGVYHLKMVSGQGTITRQLVVTK